MPSFQMTLSPLEEWKIETLEINSRKVSAGVKFPGVIKEDDTVLSGVICERGRESALAGTCCSLFQLTAQLFKVSPSILPAAGQNEWMCCQCKNVSCQHEKGVTVIQSKSQQILRKFQLKYKPDT